MNTNILKIKWQRMRLSISKKKKAADVVYLLSKKENTYEMLFLGRDVWFWMVGWILLQITYTQQQQQQLLLKKKGVASRWKISWEFIKIKNYTCVNWSSNKKYYVLLSPNNVNIYTLSLLYRMKLNNSINFQSGFIIRFKWTVSNLIMI